MLFNKNNKASNKFRPHMLPTARKLFERYGFSMVKNEHPDGTDPYKFSDPVNPHDTLATHRNTALGKSIAHDAYLEVASKNVQPAEPTEPAKPAEPVKPAKTEDLPE